MVAHPDDEYAFAATVYRYARERNGIVDQVVITNGESGFRFAQLASVFYGVNLSDEDTARQHLPEIRRRETIKAGHILGIRNHYFLDQADTGFTLDASLALTVWENTFVVEFLQDLLAAEQYSHVCVLMPSKETHGHHKSAAILTIRALRGIDPASRPCLLGADPGSRSAPSTVPGAVTFAFDRDAVPAGAPASLTYQVIVNWAAAEHKTQGLFQADGCRHDLERFWELAPGAHRAEELFSEVCKPLRFAA